MGTGDDGDDDMTTSDSAGPPQPDYWRATRQSRLGHEQLDTSRSVGFEQATAVTAEGDGRYGVDLQLAFASPAAKPNGGYLLACLGRAALVASARSGSSHAHVVAAGAQYLAAPELGPALVEVDVLRAGRTASQLRARLSQHGVPCVDARFTLTTLPVGTRPHWGGVEPVELPPIERCETFEPVFGGREPRIAFDPAAGVRWTPDGPLVSGEGELRAWFELGGAVDTVGLLYAADALPPATFGVVSTGWVPTLDLNVYVRALPAPGPLRLRFRTQTIQDGFADEHCEAWDATGRLVMQSTQLVALRMPDADSVPAGEGAPTREGP
jgi:hypothetical protein